jgi:hypothetical protein
VGLLVQRFHDSNHILRSRGVGNAATMSNDAAWPAAALPTRPHGAGMGKIARRRADHDRSAEQFCPPYLDRLHGIDSLVSSSISMGVFLTTQAVLPAPLLDADRVIGSGLLCAVIGPTLGVLAAKRLRART